MRNIQKYRGIFPAFYVCYNKEGEVSAKQTQALAAHLAGKGVQGLYLCGSSGECIYQSIAERKKTLEAVCAEVKGALTLIAHVGANNTQDSAELAAHAQKMGVDAIASIPPIYFKLPPTSIAAYWNSISDAAPNTDFIIYNIPQLAGVELTLSLLTTMLQNKRVTGVKNSSMPVQDIERFKSLGGDDFAVFNGPDEQFAAGLVMGADGGIGGTYAVMPELFLAVWQAMENGEVAQARQIQYAINQTIYTLLECGGNLYAALKSVLRLQGVEAGSVRAPLAALQPGDTAVVAKAHMAIEEAKAAFAGGNV